MAARPAYRVECDHPDRCTTRGGWSGQFYFDQPLPGRCPGCNGKVTVVTLGHERREQERAERLERERREREAQERRDAEAAAKRQAQLDAQIEAELRAEHEEPPA